MPSARFGNSISSLLATAGLIIATNAFALDPQGLVFQDKTESFRPLALSIPSELESRGLLKIQEIDVRRLKAELETIQWLWNDRPIFISGYDLKRTGGVTYADSRQVIINSVSWMFTRVRPDLKPFFLLHEGLGALGYSDVDYERSALLWYLSEIPAGEARALIQESRPLLAKKEGGGATGVGGGGDHAPVVVKAELLQLLRNKLPDLASSERFKSALDIIVNAQLECPYEMGKMTPEMRWMGPGRLHVTLPCVMIFFSPEVRSKNLELILDEVLKRAGAGGP